MAKNGKKSVQQSKTAPTVEWVGFVNCPFNVPEKEQFKSWMENVPQDYVWEQLDQYVNSEYRISFKYDYYGGGVQVALTCMSPTSPDAGLCLTGRGPDTYNALLVVLFKDSQLLLGDWVEHLDKSSEVDVWG